VTTTLYTTALPRTFVADPDNVDLVHVTTMGLYRDADLPGEPGARRAGANILWASDDDKIIVRADLPATNVPAGGRTWEIVYDPQQGQRVGFKTTVDAVARVRGKDVPVGDAGSWFLRKVEGILTDVDIQDIQFRNARRRGGSLTLTTITGDATIADPDAVEKLLREGLGRSKAFGCGFFHVWSPGS